MDRAEVVVLFRSGELEFNADVRQRDERLSVSSGQALQVLTITFRARSDEMHALALGAVARSGPGGVYSLDEAHGPEREWQVLESTTSYVGNEPWGVHHHTWLVQEVERLTCTRLVIGAIALVPDAYAEDVLADGRPRLVARSRVAEPDLRQLCAWHESQETVEVRREGINPEPRFMLVEGYAWAEEQGALSVSLTCLDAALPGTAPGANGPPAGAPGGGDADTVAELLFVLEEKGVLTEAESRRVLEQGRDRAHRRRHEARRVTSVADLPG